MKLYDTSKQRFGAASEQATTWIAVQQSHDGLVRVATDLYSRDRDAFASVLGSAVAMRMFLFVISANVALLGLINLVGLDNVLDTMLQSNPTTGAMATSYHDLSFWSALWITLSGGVFTLWAGRSLTRVLATCSTAAWQLHSRSVRVGVRVVALLTGVIIALMLSTLLLERMRDAGGITISFAVLLVVAAVFSLGWFLVQLSLPRATSDPGAMLPGAALVGLGFAVLQWFMQIYLPGKIARSTDTYGAMATTVATLSYFYLIGRLMTASFVANAVIFERWGSISQFVFGLPFVRRLPVKYPWIQRFFDLPLEGTVAVEAGDVDSSGLTVIPGATVADGALVIPDDEVDREL